MIIKFNLNGVDKEVIVSPSEYLLDTLRKIGVKSVKKGCDGAACGACTILLDDKPVLSCGVLSVRVNGHKVETVEAIQDEAAKLSECFSSEGADQCGFCNSALALIVHALKNDVPNPTDEDIEQYMVGHLCRCTGYQSQKNAIRKYLGGNK